MFVMALNSKSAADSTEKCFPLKSSEEKLLLMAAGVSEPLAH